MAGVAYRGRAFVYVLPMAGPEDLLKVGLTHDPLARWSAFHARWFEAFDIDRARLLATELRRDAQALETALRRELADFNCPAPLTMRLQAGGKREWHRGAYAAADRFLRARRQEGFVQPSARDILTQRMHESLGNTSALLHQALVDLQAGALTQDQVTALVHLVDAHRAFDGGATPDGFDQLMAEWRSRGGNDQRSPW